jgi:nucleoside-diphosphate-sugar epimerase
MILLTGITGKSGKWLIAQLMNSQSFLKKQSYRAIVRSTSNTELLDESGLNIEKTCGDLEDETFLEQALKNIDTVMHITGIGMSLKVVKAAIKNNVKWIIMVHTTGIYSKYKSANKEYLSTEKQIQQLTKNTELTVTILRPTMIYGSINDNNVAIFIKMVDKLRIFPVVSKARFSLQPVHAKDLGTAYYQVLLNEKICKGKNYVLSGKSPIRLIDMFKVIEKYLMKKNYYLSIPFPIAYIGSYLLYLLSFKKFDYREKVQRLVEPRAYSHADASRDFGYSPMSFEQGVKAEVEEYIASKK